MNVRLRPWAVAAGALLLAACAAGPDYQAPQVEVPVSWQLEAPWREAAPSDALDKGPWWQRFGDAQLDRLQQQALRNSPTLTLAGARLAQARAALASDPNIQAMQSQLGATIFPDSVRPHSTEEN